MEEDLMTNGHGAEDVSCLRRWLDQAGKPAEV
jgi:3-hydroxyisobutyrate dehydrogenase/2-hydroxy-3-oxopropionate reductase